MKLKKGDKVMVVAGKDKGKTGEITSVMTEKNRVLVSGINMVKRHQKNRAAGKGKGQIVEVPATIHASNVMLIDPKSGKPTRIKIERKDGKRVRIAKKSGSEL